MKHDNCELCDAPFTRKAKLFKRNPERNCKKCAKSICESCSESSRQLSRADPKRVRVCDLCDYEIENFKLKNSLESISKKVARTTQDFD